MGAARRRGHGWRLCCAKPPLPNRVSVVRGLPRPPRRLVLRFSSPVRLAMMREAQRRVVSNWEARWTRGGFRDRVPDRSTGSAPARSGSEPSLRSTCPSRASLPRRASRGFARRRRLAVPAFFDRHAEAWRRAAEATRGAFGPLVVNLGYPMSHELCDPAAISFVQRTRAKRFLRRQNRSVAIAHLGRT